MRFKPLATVPVFGDTSGLDTVLKRLVSLRLDTIVINGGNGEALTRELQARGHEVIDMGSNQGVGAAIQKGLQIAAKADYSGVIRVDADDAYNEVAIADILSGAAHEPSQPVLTYRFGHIRRGVYSATENSGQRYRVGAIQALHWPRPAGRSQRPALLPSTVGR